MCEPKTRLAHLTQVDSLPAPAHGNVMGANPHGLGELHPHRQECASAPSDRDERAQWRFPGRVIGTALSLGLDALDRRRRSQRVGVARA
jgi:hypothetical protein